ncbi:MAG: FolB domain-containing protein [Gammaproteobacteria bacterium]|nr:MAG: FolB domain-containing protein [Gammaproteobacteria bacterium]
MRAGLATIRIVNLRLRTYIGFNPDERAKQQDVVINASIEHQVSPEALNDHVSGALDYKVISKAIIRHVEEGRFLLLEKLVNDIVEICSRDPAIIKACVEVQKPHALRFADSVSLSMEYDRTIPTSGNEDKDGKHSRSFSETA